MPSQEQNREVTSILLVDDTPENLRLLSDLLKSRGYRIYAVTNGRLALQSALHTLPDLILLDVNMPVMDGFETCEQLKANPALREIPVIFLSAMSESLDKVKAFSVGAVDYITKPYQIEEVEVRVQTHLENSRLKRALKNQNERLEAMVARRTQQLVGANRRLGLLDKAKSDFLTMISHELRTPLSGLFLTGEILLDEFKDDEKAKEIRDIFDQSRFRILSLINDAVLLTRIDVKSEQFFGSQSKLDEVLKDAIEHAAGLAKTMQVQIKPDECPNVAVQGDPELLSRAVESMIETAIKFTTTSVSISIQAHADDGKTHLHIDAPGRKIPEHVLPQFFEMLAIGEAINEGGDIGLAPVVASRIMALFDGSVSVMNTDPKGIRLSLHFPGVSHSY